MSEVHGTWSVQYGAIGGNLIRLGIIHIHKQYEGLKGRLYCGQKYSPETWEWDGVEVDDIGCERCKRAYQKAVGKASKQPIS